MKTAFAPKTFVLNCSSYLLFWLLEVSFGWISDSAISLVLLLPKLQYTPLRIKLELSLESTAEMTLFPASNYWVLAICLFCMTFLCFLGINTNLLFPLTTDFAFSRSWFFLLCHREWQCRCVSGRIRSCLLWYSWERNRWRFKVNWWDSWGWSCSRGGQGAAVFQW